MKIGIIGSGVVAQTLGTKLVELGHDVVLGTRDPSKLDEKKNMAGTLREWLASVTKAEQGKAKVATFQEAAAHGELLINATHGQASVEALKLAGADKVGPQGADRHRRTSWTSARGCRRARSRARAIASPRESRPRFRT